MVVHVWNLGVLSFDTALKIQQALMRKQLSGASKQDTNYDTILLVQHKPVYTVGIRDETPLEEANRLRDLGAEFKKTSRGGLITFHGPGQLVAYPILNLKHFKTSVKWYVSSLEETVIRVCQELGIKANRSEHTGVWVGDSKLAAIGIHASRYVTTHGISLNCDNDLSWFEHIDPFGMDDNGVTSLTKETGLECTVEHITPLFLRSFGKVFQCDIEELGHDMQEEILKSIYNKLLSHNVQEKVRIPSLLAGVTSLTKETGLECTVEHITPLFLRSFGKVFQCDIEELVHDMQEEILKSIYNKLLSHNVQEKVQPMTVPSITVQ